MMSTKINNRVFYIVLIFSVLIFKTMSVNCQIKSVTKSESGHIIHHNNVFSKDNKWIVFDGRVDDSKIGETSTIGIVNVETGEERIIYKSKNQTQFGPGVGAASFSPIQDDVIFIHGLYDANQEKPYALSRRVGVGVNILNPLEGFHYDARDMFAPYTPGSLRGGTHSHCWSGDGNLISFTYNDELVDPDLRMVGVMVQSASGVKVDTAAGNNSGKLYSAIVTNVVRNPEPGSDQINKAFDECWVGNNGYTDSNGVRHPYAIAYQGNTVNERGEIITEIYVVNIDSSTILNDKGAVGIEGERPRVPNGINSYRLSRTSKGLSDFRHWLRSSADGKFIYALAKDDQNRNQLVSCSTETGVFEYLSQFDFSINSPINISYVGDKLAFFADNSIYVFSLKTREVNCLVKFNKDDIQLIGSPVFSRNDQLLAFNYKSVDPLLDYIQISTIKP